MLPENFEYNEQIFRYGDKKHLWAIGKVFTYKGKEYRVHTEGNWRTGERSTVKSWTKDVELKDQSFRKKVLKESKLIRATIDLEEEEKWTKAKEKAQLDWEKFSSEGLENCKYIEKKNINVYGNVKRGLDGSLIVPTYDDAKEICGYQHITDTTKLFQTGQRMKGVYFPIGDIEKSDIIFMAEGYATSCTIHELTGYPVVVAFNCHNLNRAISTVRSVYGYKNIVLAGEVEAAKASRTACRKCEKSNSGVISVFPDFGSELSELSDFNDLHNAYGLEEAKRQLEFDKTKFNKVYFLGHSVNRYYFYSDRSRQVRSFSPSEMRAGDLVSMARNEYWALNYHSVPSDRKKCAWSDTVDDIISIQESEYGLFFPERVRGFGVWKENGQIILNTGKELYLDGKKIDFGYIGGTHFYTPSAARIIKKSKYDSRNFELLHSALSLVDFRTERDLYSYIGFLAQAAVFSCLNWKSHVWLVAPAGTGKSTLLEFMNSLCLNSIYFQNSTPAGIRQTISSDAIVSIVDEMEGEKKSNQQIVELAREASSGHFAKIARGTPSGKAFSQSLTAVFCFGSIKQPSLTEADESRIINISLRKNKAKDHNRETKRKELFYEIKNSDLGSQIFFYMVDNFKIYREKIKTVNDAFRASGASARQADQYSNIAAGAWMLMPEKPLQGFIDVFLEEAKKNSDEQDFNVNILSRIWSLKLKDGSEDVILGEYIDACVKESFAQGNHAQRAHFHHFLKMYGIKIVSEYVHFRKNDALKREFQRLDVPDIYSVMKNDKDHFENSIFKWDGSAKVLRSHRIKWSLLTQ